MTEVAEPGPESNEVEWPEGRPDPEREPSHEGPLGDRGEEGEAGEEETEDGA